jgi:hypothetical protein
MFYYWSNLVARSFKSLHHIEGPFSSSPGARYPCPLWECTPSQSWKLLPKICRFSRYKLLPNRRGTVAGFGMAPSSRRAEGDGGGGRHAWGQGNRLDGDN